jgi:Leucine-rich repeat (LRR) protein
MSIDGLMVEASDFGTKVSITSAWSRQIHEQILRLQPEEIILNRSLGWAGSDLNFLRAYSWLISVVIIDFKIQDVSPIHALGNLVNLEVLTYCKTPIDFDLFPKLQRCSLEWRPKAISIFKCTTIVDLFINRYTGKNSDPFGSLSSLQVLGILNSPMTEISTFAQLKDLRSLRLGNLSQLRSLEGLETLDGLLELEIDTCRSLASIESLSNLKSLKTLLLNNCGEVGSLGPLKGLSELQKVIFHESTNILDGDLNFIFSNGKITSVAFQDRKHYSHKRLDFGVRAE